MKFLSEIVVSFHLLATLCEGLAPRSDDRIVGGIPVDIKNYPYQLSLQYNGKHICGASLLTEYWVLTAAHCVEQSPYSSISLRANNTYKTINGGQLRQIQAYAQHPYYNRNTQDYDFAIIKVTYPFALGEGVRAISMSSSTPYTNALLTLSGWGSLYSGGPSPSQLQAVNISVSDLNICNKTYGNQLTDRMFCGQLVGKDSCQGDSGGPAVVTTTSGSRLLAGVVSFGVGCALPKYPGVYSSVALARSWIKQYTGF